MSWIQGRKEILEFSEAGGDGKFSEAGEEFFRGGESNSSASGRGGTQNSVTKIILKMILIQK